MKHVIIGAGAAGIAAARTIRQQRSEDEIVIISSDAHVHSRCMLHKYISGERVEQTLSFVPEHFFQERDIRWCKAVTINGIDTDKKEVMYSSGTQSYDKLLIATGAVSVIPPIGQLRTAGNVFGLRDLPDAQKIRQKAKQAQNVVVIGAGLVGLDAVYGLLEMGKKPVVVEMADTVLAMNLDRHGAHAYQKKFEEAGCSFHLGRKVSDTVCNASGDVSGIVLDTGEQLACDMVIVAAGVRPATSLLAESDIVVDRSIVVNEYLATNIPDVYAAGDVAGLSGIWPNAQKQGQVAGYNMCGIPMVYQDTFAVKNTVNFFDMLSLSVGQREPSEGDTVVIREDRNCYEKYIMHDDVVVGILLQGDISGSGFWQYLIKNKIHVGEIDKPVWKLSFADFYGVAETGEYVWA